MNSLFPEEEAGYYGSVYPMCYSYALAEITEKRVEEIKQWLIGSEGGNVCSGSVKTPEEIEEFRNLKSYR